MIRRSCYSRYRTRLDWMAPRSTPKTPCSRAPIKLIFELGVDSGYTNAYAGATTRVAHLPEPIAACQMGGFLHHSCTI